MSIDFDGADDNITYGSAADIDDLAALTVSAWIFPVTDGDLSSGTIMAKASGSINNGWKFDMAATNTLRFRQEFATTNLTRTGNNSAVTMSAWNHVALTWDGSATAANVHIYVNGVEITYATTTDGVDARASDAAQTLKIGGIGVATNFDGDMVDVRIYNRVLTLGEIATIRASYGADGIRGGLLGHWPTKELNSGQTVVSSLDVSGNARNGTINNGPVYSDHTLRRRKVA